MGESYRWTFRQMNLRQVTLDVDSTALPRYGNQMERVVWGYNPRHHGRNSHHPLLAMVGSVRNDCQLLVEERKCRDIE